jgi:uroporphyrinogen decarboxylase
MKLIDIVGEVGRRKGLRPLGLPVAMALRQMRLSTMVRLSGRRICIPSAGYSAIALSGTTIGENLSDGRRMFETLEAAITEFRLEADGTVSDLTIEPEACGCSVMIPDTSTPYVLEHPVKSLEDVRALVRPDPLTSKRMKAMAETVKLLSERFTLPTVAGGSGPFTLAAELVGATEAAMFTITDPGMMHELLRYCTGVCIDYLSNLISSGAEIILLGEPTAAILSPASFREFSGRYVSQVIKAVGRPVILHICGDAGHLVEPMCETGAQGLSLDSAVDLPTAARKVPKDVVLVGNLDTVSVLLEGDPVSVRAKTMEMLESMRGVPNYVASAGCDLSYSTPVDNVIAMIEAVREFR